MFFGASLSPVFSLIARAPLCVCGFSFMAQKKENVFESRVSNDLFFSRRLFFYIIGFLFARLPHHIGLQKVRSNSSEGVTSTGSGACVCWQSRSNNDND